MLRNHENQFYAHFTAEDFVAADENVSVANSTSVWRSATNANDNMAVVSGNNVNKIEQAEGENGVAKGFFFLHGTCKSQIRFVHAPLFAYTIFHLSRYVCNDNDNDNENDGCGRILNNRVGDWISGFYKGKIGVAYEGNAWISGKIDAKEEEEEVFGVRSSGDRSSCKRYHWILSTNCPGNYRCNGVQSSNSEQKKRLWCEDAISHAAAIPLEDVGVNFQNGIFWENSHFGIAEIIIVDRTLNLDEIEQIETYFAHKYGIMDML